MNTKIANDFIFGTCIITSSQIFLSCKNIFAIINHKPFLPGHVLVCSRRNVQKLS
jgi:diadenosine tetraphosphate (Ap4A) HIT family hydrolase